ncbi:hypothetical protein STAQ_48680 [Allostella sp. ATCC 35155]|nr:hypothetical protein STAQ_48680 [Stella sp. ATCC 35155]
MDPSTGIVGSLLHHAARTPWRPFLILRRGRYWQQYSYKEAVVETRRWAAALRSAGVAADQHVTIALTHCADIYFAFLGAVWLGAVPTIIPFPTPKQDPSLYWPEYADLLAELRPSALVTYADNAQAMRQALGGISCAVLEAPLARSAEPEKAGDPAMIAAGRPLFVQYSSGTTGRRKGVAPDASLLAAHAAALGPALGLDGTDRIASWLPLYHDMGLVGCFLTPLSFGSTIIALDPFEWTADPAILLDAIERFRATLVWMPNFAFRHTVRTLPEDAAYRLDTVRAFVSSAEPCRPETMAGFVTALSHLGVRGDQIRPCYGLAEAVLAAALAPPRPQPRTLRVDAVALEQDARARVVRNGKSGSRAFASCGPALRGIELRIASRGRGVGLPVGEIELRGSHCFQGYFRNSAATDTAFRDGWYRTGDIGFIEGDELFVCGRTKEIVIVNGRNLYAPDVEAAAGEAAGVKPGRICAFGVEDEEIGTERLIVLVETADGQASRTLIRSVKSAITRRLQATPHRVVAVPPGHLVKTTSGKMHRAENRRRFLQDGAGG